LAASHIQIVECGIEAKLLLALGAIQHLKRAAQNFVAQIRPAIGVDAFHRGYFQQFVAGGAGYGEGPKN
jgi:hypothetical protein